MCHSSLKELFEQEFDVFAPGLRKDGDMFTIDSHQLSVTHAADYNSYQVMTLQARTSVENEEVRNFIGCLFKNSLFVVKNLLLIQ